MEECENKGQRSRNIKHQLWDDLFSAIQKSIDVCGPFDNELKKSSLELKKKTSCDLMGEAKKKFGALDLAYLRQQFEGNKKAHISVMLFLSCLSYFLVCA